MGRQPLLPLGEKLIAARNHCSSQPLPDKSAWDAQPLKLSPRRAVTAAGPNILSRSQEAARGSDKAAVPSSSLGRQHLMSGHPDKQGSAGKSAACSPKPQLSAHGEDAVRELGKDAACAEDEPTPAQEPQHLAEDCSPSKQLSFHLTPTLEVQQSSAVSAQQEALAAAPSISAHKECHSASADQDQAAILVPKAQHLALSPQALSPKSCEAASGSQAEQAIMSSEADVRDKPENAAEAGPSSTGMSLAHAARDLSATEVQHCPTQLLPLPCAAVMSTLVEEEPPSMAASPRPADPAEACDGAQSRHSKEGSERQGAHEHNDAAQSEQAEPARPQPAGTCEAPAGQQQEDCQMTTSSPSDRAQGCSDNAAHAGAPVHSPAAATSAQDPGTINPPQQLAENEVEAPVAGGPAACIHGVDPRQSPGTLRSPQRTDAMVSPLLSVQVSSNPPHFGCSTSP